jgi:adenylate cyclase
MYKEPATVLGPFFRAYAPKSNLEVFTTAAASSGYFSLRSDADGVVRWMPLVIQGGEDIFPPLAVACAWHYLGKPSLTVEVGRYGVDGIQMGKRYIPTDEHGQLLINYLGPPRTFPYFSISDVLNGQLPSGTFTDKVVLIGATAMGIQDLLPTPLSTASWVEIHATVIDNILTQRFLTHPKWSKIYDLLAIILLGTAIGIALPRLGAFKGLLCVTALSLVHLVVARWLFVHAGVSINIVYPLLVVGRIIWGMPATASRSSCSRPLAPPRAANRSTTQRSLTLSSSGPWPFRWNRSFSSTTRPAYSYSMPPQMPSPHAIQT